MSNFIKDIKKIEYELKLKKTKIRDKIYLLKEELEIVDQEGGVSFFEYGKNIKLKDIDMFGRDFDYFPELVNGYVLEHGISKENINEHDLNIIVHGYNLSNYKEKYAEKIKESFFNNLEEKERFILATFFPKYIEYKDLLMGDFPLIDSKNFSWIHEYFYKTFSILLCRGSVNCCSLDDFKIIARNCIFSGISYEKVLYEPVIDYTEDLRKYTFICLNNKALKDIDETKFLVNKIKEFGYEFDFRIHPEFGDQLTVEDLKMLTE